MTMEKIVGRFMFTRYVGGEASYKLFRYFHNVDRLNPDKYFIVEKSDIDDLIHLLQAMKSDAQED